MADKAWIMVTLREWLESQRLENTPHRAALSEAMNQGDTETVRQLLQEAPFSRDQRRYLDDLIARWHEAEAEADSSAV